MAKEASLREDRDRAGGSGSGGKTPNKALICSNVWTEEPKKMAPV